MKRGEAVTLEKAKPRAAIAKKDPVISKVVPKLKESPPPPQSYPHLREWAAVQREGMCSGHPVCVGGGGGG